MRMHTDNSVLFRYYNNPNTKLLPKAAFSATFDIGGEQGDGVTPFGGAGTEGKCSNSRPCNQHFLSWMIYNRFWFFDGLLALNMGGGMMENPGRYLVLSPTGQASGFTSNLSTPNIAVNLPTSPFDFNAGTSFQAWDVMSGLQFMPTQLLSYDLEWSYRASSVPYFAGHGGVTSPDGYITTNTPAGWRADLRPNDLRLIAAMMVRF